MGVDWKKIKREYERGGVSMRALSRRYGASYSTLRRRVLREGWRSGGPGGAEEGGDRVTRMRDLLLDRLEQAAAELSQTAVRRTRKEREVEYGDPDTPGKPTREVIREEEALEVANTPIDRSGLRQLAAALKDLRAVTDAEEEGVEDLSPLAALLAVGGGEAAEGDAAPVPRGEDPAGEERDDA